METGVKNNCRLLQSEVLILFSSRVPKGLFFEGSVLRWVFPKAVCLSRPSFPKAPWICSTKLLSQFGLLAIERYVSCLTEPEQVALPQMRCLRWFYKPISGEPEYPRSVKLTVGLFPSVPQRQRGCTTGTYCREVLLSQNCKTVLGGGLPLQQREL